MKGSKRVGSVRLRITIFATAVVALALIIGSFALLGLFRGALLKSQSGAAAQHAESVAALAVDGVIPNPLPSLDAPRLTLVQVLNDSGDVVAASEQLQGLAPLAESNQVRRKIVHEINGLHDGPWLTEVAHASVGGKPLTFIIVTSLTEYARSADLLHTSMLITVPVLVLLVAIIVWFVVGRALRPVETMRAEVENITGHRLDRRVAAPTSNDEISRLALTLNDMLDRVQQSSDAQRRFVADASHELRTPIANIRIAVEVANAHPELADWPAVAEDILHQDERMQYLTDDLLLLAKAEAGQSALRRGPVDLRRVVANEMRRPVPPDKELTTDTRSVTDPSEQPRESAPRLDDCVVDGDADQLSRMLTNLVDNALRHAAHTVTVSVDVTERSVRLTVADDGPGIPTEDRDHVFDPFVRLDQHRARDQGGTGLGLSIVRRVVQAHGGTVEIVDTVPAPGATFIVTLLRQRDAAAAKL